MPAPLLPLLSAALALAAVLGLILLAAALARRSGIAARFGGRGGGRRHDPALANRLVLETSLALDPRRRVHLLRCADRHVLLLTGGPQDVLLGWLPPPPEPGPHT
ncbi:MAG: flagellar biosynthetic protein FliO [Rhodospirillales bacterium]|nr:flagellar biosynthetic protein FliO [Rhodospirillales bacterium]